MFVKHYTQKLTEAVVGKNPSDFSFYEFSGQFNLDSFAAAVQSVPFMSEHNCVLVTDIFYDLLKKDESDEIIKICSLASSSVIVIVSMPSYTPEKNSAYFDALVKRQKKSALYASLKDSAKIPLSVTLPNGRTKTEKLFLILRRKAYLNLR